MFPGPPASGLPGNLLEMQILRSIQWGRGGGVWNPAICVLTSRAGDSEYEIHCCCHVTCISLPKTCHPWICLHTIPLGRDYPLFLPIQILYGLQASSHLLPSSLSLHWIPSSALIWTLFREPLAVHPVLVCILYDLHVTGNTAFLDSSRFAFTSTGLF